MDKLLDYMVDHLASNQELDDEDKETVRYGLEILYIKVFFTVCAMFIAALFHCFWECLIFLIMFSAIRTSAGGYHAKTRIQCFIMSMLMIIINIGVVKLTARFPSLDLILISLTLVSIVVIWILSPIDTNNRPFEYDERIRFKNKTRVLLCLETVVAFIMKILNINIMMAVILLSMIFVAALLIMGLISKRINNGL